MPFLFQLNFAEELKSVFHTFIVRLEYSSHWLQLPHPCCFFNAPLSAIPCALYSNALPTKQTQKPQRYTSLKLRSTNPVIGCNRYLRIWSGDVTTTKKPNPIFVSFLSIHLVTFSIYTFNNGTVSIHLSHQIGHWK